MAMSDKGFAHAMQLLSGDQRITSSSPLIPEHALAAFIERIESDKPMHINAAIPLAGDRPLRNAIIAIIMAHPASIISEVWGKFIDNKPASLKALVDREMARRKKAVANALLQQAEHKRRSRLAGNDIEYPKTTQSADERRNFVARTLGRTI